MAAVVTILKRSKNLSVNQNIVTIAFDSSYPTGGESVTAAQFGLQTIDFVLLSNNGGNDFEYDYSANKVKARVTTTGVEVANTTSLATVTTRAIVFGT